MDLKVLVNDTNEFHLNVIIISAVSKFIKRGDSYMVWSTGELCHEADRFYTGDSSNPTIPTYTIPWRYAYDLYMEEEETPTLYLPMPKEPESREVTANTPPLHSLPILKALQHYVELGQITPRMRGLIISASKHKKASTYKEFIDKNTVADLKKYENVGPGVRTTIKEIAEDMGLQLREK